MSEGQYLDQDAASVALAAASGDLRIALVMKQTNCYA